MIYYKPNLDQALASLAALIPHLPAPRITEHMNGGGIALPKITTGNENLPVIEMPETLVGDLPAFPAKLPRKWMASRDHHQSRLFRNFQWLHYHRVISEAQIRDNEWLPPSDMYDLDGVTAGLLLLVCRPLPSPVREKLISRTKTHWWGAYWAAQGVLFGTEAQTILHGIANDPRLVANLYLTDKYLAAPLIPLAMERNDLWSAIIALAQPLGDLWLGRVCIQAEYNALSALTALVLQPNGTASAKWIQKLQTGHPRLAYLAVRWARFTWLSNWENLRDQLRVKSCSDAGLSWFHWYRDVDTGPEQVNAALGQSDVDLLWQAELIAFLGDDGQMLRRQMLANHPDDLEAQLALNWLHRRPGQTP